MNITWPRMMKRQTAAQYCDLSIAAFEAEITAGRLPSPVMLGRREHWCIKALDRALDVLTGDAAIVKLEAHRKIIPKSA